MSHDGPSQAYLRLANELFVGKTSEKDLQPATAGLPQLDQDLLAQLAAHAEGFASTTPRHGWAIAQVTYAASLSQHCDLFLQSRAAWYLGRACNHWAQPKRVSAVLSAAGRGFAELNEAGWRAACDWQLNALPWTKPNFAQAAQSLQQALEDLEGAGFTEFIPDCRLALAYAQILIGRHEAALENIRASEETYLTRGDALNQARCWLTRASSLRRQDHFDEAFQQLDLALTVFDKENAVTDQAKAHYQIALGHLLKADNLPDAVAQFTKAAELFHVVDLDLWRAMCINNLGSVYLFTGELALSDKYYREARDIFIHHEISGLLADNLNDHGEMNSLRGKPQLSVEKFKQSIELNKKLGAQLSTAIVTTNLGKAYGQLGRYQDALYHLERAIEQLEPLQAYFRLATCEKHIASIWSRLARPLIAHTYLDQAAAHYEMADQKALLASVFNYRAATFFQQGLETEAVNSLKQSLAVAEEYGLRPQSALAKRLLGEALIRTERRAEALEYLRQAQADFAGMGMTMEHATCLVSIGKLLAEPESAKDTFEEALQLSAGTFPEVDWRAYMELGELAGMQGDVRLALRNYRSGVAAFTQIRRNFLQPALAGSYLQTPAHVFDRIVAVSSRADAAQDALHFIEEAKASTLLRSLSLNNAVHEDPGSQELDDLKAEIDLLQNRLRVSLDETPVLQSALQTRQTRARLLKLVEAYDELKTRRERKFLSEGSTAAPSGSFDLDLFRKKASAFLAGDWVALDYYISESELVTVIVTPHDCQVYSQPISKRFSMALDACDRVRRNADVEAPLESDLEILGKILIPDSLAEDLLPGTHLLLAPHRGLHQVPWAALKPAFATQPLVCICIPGVVPSLHGLALLWERGGQVQGTDRSSGLLVGLSTFNGLREELSMVRDEIDALRLKLSSGGRVLAEKDATWEHLLEVINEEVHELNGAKRSHFAWLHIASHFFSDRHTGRLSGIAFRDGDIWLDQLRDLAPLPGLITLSACNSNDSFLYEGDERMDLQTTCFMAGANSVVGSAWPVLDRAAAELIALFYDSYLSGSSPAQAAARAQRQFITAGQELKSWASFVCAGIP